MPFYLRIILFLFIAAWFVGSIYPHLASASNNESLVSFILERSYSLVCHTNPEKLICFNDSCSLVCARCFGIYSGACVISFITLLAARVNIKSLRLLFIVSIFMLLDVILYSISVYNYSKITAAVTGVFFGSGAFLYIRSGLEKLWEEFKK